MLFAGRLLHPDRVEEGFVEVEDGRVVASGRGEPEGAPHATGWIVPAPVNAHTHCADTFLRDVPGKPRTVKELVGPGGWKHRHLATADPAAQRAGVERLAAEMAAVGTARFLDFREGGVDGVRWLRALAGDLPVGPVVLGRPARGGFDEDEAARVLAVADGIGLSGMRDVAYRDIEAWAEACHEAQKPFALHVGEDRRDDMGAVLALEPAFVVHVVHATTEDLDDLADARVPVVVCPRSNARFGRVPPVDRMLESGVAVAVGTDNGMLSDGDVRNELALLHARFPRIPVEDLLRMASHHGRRLAGLPPGLPVRRGDVAELVVLPDDPLPPGPARRPRLEPAEGSS